MASRVGKVLGNYHLMIEIIRQTMTMDVADRMTRGEKDLKSRWGFSAYLRTSGRNLQNGIIENNNTRWGHADT